MRKSTLSAVLLCGLLAPGLAACGTDDPPASGSTSASPSATARTQAESLTVTDPWVKAAGSGMTAAFGTLSNTSDADIDVVGASTTVNDMTELHETVENADGSMAMRPKEGGFVVPAGGELTLAPGGDHLMLMDLKGPVAAGTTVTITLTLADGSTTEVEATVKPFEGGDEKYQPSAGSS